MARGKLAVWSWILPLVGIFLSFFIILMAGENVGLVVVVILVFYLGAISGLIFGIVALRQISQNPRLNGKGHAIVGIILGALLIIVRLFGSFLFD